MNALLHVDSVTRTFGGVAALSDVSLEVGPGQRVALIGPNGAGKSTLVNCIAGLLRPSTGDVRFDGRSVGHDSAERRYRAGISRTFQNLELFVSMTALENVMVAVEGSGSVSRWRRGAATEARRRAMESLEMLGIQRFAHRPVAALPYGVRKLTELGRAFVTQPKLLLLDEPVAGLSDTDEFLATLSGALDNLGCAVLLVEHDMETVQRLTDFVYVLDAGRTIARGSYAEVSRDPAVVEAYLGRDGDLSTATAEGSQL
jgi:ABC-type branched-subunit amino acid transport system ATPase component